jgi:hypothetical protein
MLHLLPTPRSAPDTPAPDVEPDPSVVTHHHWPGTGFMKAIGHIHVAPPQPPRLYPLHEASYLEAELMSRLMEHL